MPKYKNYVNKHTKNSIIHIVEDIVKMSFGDVAKREKELASQYNQIGIPSNTDMQNSSSVVYVNEYTRDDGTVVRAHWRSKPEGNYIDYDKSRNVIEDKNKIDNQEKFPDGVISNPNDDYNPQLYGHVEISDIKDNILRKPAEPIKNLFNEMLNNKIDYDSNKSTWEKVQEKIYTKWFDKIFPMASETTENGMNYISAAKKDINAKIYKSLDDLKDKDLRSSLKKYGVNSRMKGVYYNNDSNNSQIISKSSEIKEIIDDLCKNGGKTSKTSLEFNFDIKHPKESFDRYASIQHAQIHNPRISEDNNYMECSIIDISDFEKRPATIKNIPNNWGYNMQDKGQYENYYIIIDIKIPLTNEQKELLRKNQL